MSIEVQKVEKSRRKEENKKLKEEEEGKR